MKFWHGRKYSQRRKKRKCNRPAFILYLSAQPEREFSVFRTRGEKNFGKATRSLTAKFLAKTIHGGSHAPSDNDWFAGGDTLDQQVYESWSEEHGTYAGVVPSWVITPIKGANDSTNAAIHESYYTNSLRFHTTKIKGSARHIRSNVA